VENGKGKKAKKAWQLALGPKGALLSGLGIVGLMLVCFILGTLAGRGDIYRVAYAWGLLAPKAPEVAQWTPANEATGVTPNPAGAPAGGAAVASVPASPVPGTPSPAPAVAVAHPTAPHPPAAAPAPVSVAAKPGHPAPVTASIAPLPHPTAAAPPPAKKKGKTGTIHKDPKAREEELQRERQAVVSKLKFQNSFDTGPKPRQPKAKDHDKAQVKAAGAKSHTLIRVAQYRSSKEADAKVAELHKKGVKATLRKSKDSKGTLYVVCKPESSPQPAVKEPPKNQPKATVPPKN
jgi:hypothetical protein